MHSDAGDFVLPDLLAPGLDVVFVGTAAGRTSAERGAYYAHPGNRFWRTLHEIGLTPRRFEPEDFRSLLELRIGLTDVSKVGSGRDNEIEAHQFSVSRFEARIRHYRPLSVAFTSKKAASLWLQVPTSAIELGRQFANPAEFPEVFVLSSPSGAACRHWSITPWQELAKWLRTPRA